MIINEAAENYLETILMEINMLGTVRSTDICNTLGYSKSTVSIAMKKLRENGFIKVDNGGCISLTPRGRKIADQIYERNLIIAEYLISIGVDKETAYQYTCKIEHDISDVSFRYMKKYYYRNNNNCINN